MVNRDLPNLVCRCSLLCYSNFILEYRVSSRCVLTVKPGRRDAFALTVPEKNLNLAANTTVILTLCRAICTNVLLLHHTLPLQSLHIPVSNCTRVHWTNYHCYTLCNLGWIFRIYYPSWGKFRWLNSDYFWFFSFFLWYDIGCKDRPLFI